MHDDLLIVYAEAPGQPASAIYFDNEDHVIHYKVSFPEDGKSIVFITDPSEKAPRFRLTYTQTDNNKVGIKFEFAPPGKPDAFTPYIQATAVRK